MEDIVPSLYKKIYDDFYDRVNNDIEIQRVLKEEREIPFVGVSLLSRRLGRYASKSLIKYLNEENLPDGRLYWNILERTVKPLMKEVHELVNDMAVITQLAIDKKQNIGIKPVRSEFNEDRINAIMNKLMALQNEVDYGKEKYIS